MNLTQNSGYDITQCFKEEHINSCGTGNKSDLFSIFDALLLQSDICAPSFGTAQLNKAC